MTKVTITSFIILITTYLNAQTNSIDINGDGSLNILLIGTSKSIQDNYVAFSPFQIATELQNILAEDTSLNLNVNVIPEDIYRTKIVSTGIANQITTNRNYYCHSLMQYYYWPDNIETRHSNLAGQNNYDWDYVVISADPYIIANMPGYYSLGVNKIASLVQSGGAVPLLLVEWTNDTSSISHFEEFTYRTSLGAKVPIEVIPAGLGWLALPNNLIDSSTIHPTPNGAYLAAASIYSNLLKRDASFSQYIYNDSIAYIAEMTRINAMSQTHFTGPITFISPFKSCEITDSNLIYNHCGTSTEYGILGGLQSVVASNQKTIQFGSVAPIHFNYGRSSMGTTHLYQINPALFEYSFGYPLQDDASTGFVSMMYGLDKRQNSNDVETDLGTARQMINQSQLPYARNVPLRTIIAQMLEEIPDVQIYPTGDPWHLSSDVNIAIGTYIYTILTGDCTLPPSPTICEDLTQWRTWMAHKIGQETAWNLMYLQASNSCNKEIDNQTSCGPFTWINGMTFNSSNTAATYTFTNNLGCDSMIILNLTVNTIDTTVSQSGVTLIANQEGATYQWLDCDNNNEIIFGETGQTFSATANGNYAVEITENGCVETSDCIAITTLGIIENKIDNSFMAYPNPTSGQLSIVFKNEFSNMQITVRNIFGQVVFYKSYSSGRQIYLTLEGGAAGFYFIEIFDGDKQGIIKVLKD